MFYTTVSFSLPILTTTNNDRVRYIDREAKKEAGKETVIVVEDNTQSFL